MKISLSPSLVFAAISFWSQKQQSVTGVTDEECEALNFSSCDECTKKGCLWSPKHGYCEDKEYTFGGKKLEYEKTCPTDADNVFTDPLYTAQEWVYDIINVQPAWKEGIRGKGIVVQIVDDGVAVDHPEFKGRFDADLSCEEYKPEGEDDVHGTACASIALANADNGECAAGIAPEATLAACLTNDIEEAFLQAAETADISSNSWNFDACERIYSAERRLHEGKECPMADKKGKKHPIHSDECGKVVDKYCREKYEEDLLFCEKYRYLYVKCSYNEIDEVHRKALKKAIRKGRDGKGVIFVFAAGNEHDTGETVNMEGFLSSRYTIAVAAVDQGKVHSSYSSTGGSALFISGPGGDREYTTNHITAKVGGGCYDATIGTSFATPAVAGAIALVLQANENLGWRDVQGVLATSAQKFEKDSKLWTKNAAGFSHHPFYGFGVMDVANAVKVAKDWKNYGEDKHITVRSDKIDIPIPDDSTKAAVSKLKVPDKKLVTEHVLVTVHVLHPSRGNLQVLLESPQGTKSELVPSNRRETGTDDASWQLMTLLNWGEDPAGEWKLTLVDHIKGNLAGVDESEECVDLPFKQEIEEMEVTCKTFIDDGVCKDGEVDPDEEENAIEFYQDLDEDMDGFVDDDTGLALEEACCECGGGAKWGTLVSWSLRVYGHESGEGETITWKRSTDKGSS